MVEILSNKNAASRFQIMVAIAAHEPGLQQKDIAQQIGITPQAISSYVRELVKRGMLIYEGRSQYRVSMEGVDWSAVKAFSSTGECSNPEDMLYLMMLAGYKPIIEYCGGTEIGGGYITGTVVQPASPATFSTPALGLDVHIADEQGKPSDMGELYLVPPSIGLSNSLIGADHREVYFGGTPPGPDGQILRRHGDEMEHLGGGYFRAHGRVDDTMNLHGIKVSSSEIERVVAGVEGIHEAAAVAVPQAGGGPEELIVYVVLEENAEFEGRKLKAAVQKATRTRLSNLFVVADVVPVASLPRTASNKVMRRVLRQEYAEGRQ